MNAIAKVDQPGRAEVIEVLRNSLYPGAKTESVEMVLSYCRVHGVDPMLKAVHIVPMWDKEARVMRDVLMPGIADYRIKAARSGHYAGKDEPEFGPDVTRTFDGVTVTFPAWCKVTIYRMLNGTPRPFTAKEYWTENYATAKRDSEAPNAMWRKRPYGQLAKCSEAQALRMAFPEFSGGAPTAEEMEGKTLDGFTGQTIEGSAIKPRPTASRAEPAADIPALDDPPKPDGATFLERIRRSAARCSDADAVLAIGNHPAFAAECAKHAPEVAEEARAILAEAYARFQPTGEELPEQDAGEMLT